MRAKLNIHSGPSTLVTMLLSATVSAQTLSERYPGEVNLASDPRVVFSENFEGALSAKWSARWYEPGMVRGSDRPAASSGQTSLRFVGSLTNTPAIANMLPSNYDRL